jgi:hypothetical protein
MPKTWSFGQKIHAQHLDRISISTKASSSFGDQRVSRLSVLEMLTDRSRGSVVNQVPLVFQRQSSE